MSNTIHFSGSAEDSLQTWRDRLLGKRLSTSNPLIVTLPEWQAADPTIWEPRIYLNTTPRSSLDSRFTYEAQSASRFLNLPAEVRNKVLELVLRPQTRFEKEHVGSRLEIAVWTNISAVIFCCKQLYGGGRVMVVQGHTMEYETLPEKHRLCAVSREECSWLNELNVMGDMKTNAIKMVFIS